MTQIIDRALSFLPGSKAYVTGIVMALIAIMQLAGFSTAQIDLAFDPEDAGNLFLEGIALIFMRRGIKDYLTPETPKKRGIMG